MNVLRRSPPVAQPFMHRPSIFSSFWIAGFESACHITRQGHRLDMIAATQHDRFVEEDYVRLRQVGITSVTSVQSAGDLIR